MSEISGKDVRRNVPVARSEMLLLALVLAAALAWRVVDLRFAPPGAQHDEVFSANFATQILNGARPVFFDQNGGVMALYAYLVAPAFALFGANIVVLRLVSAACGVAAILFTWLAARRLFGPFVALASAALMGATHWHLFESRAGLEPVALLALAAATAWRWAEWQSASGSREPAGGRMREAVTVGALAGLTCYTYQSGVLVPAALAGWAVYLFVWHRSEWRTRRRSLAAMGATALVVAAPLAFHLLTTAGDATSRTEDLAIDLRAAFAGDVEPLARNVGGVLGMLALSGDPSWRYNLAGRPVFTPVAGALAYAGLALCLLRWRDPRYAFVAIWIGCNVLASAVTRASPSFLRSSGALPMIAVLAPLAAEEIRRRLPAGRRAPAVFGAALLALLAWEGTSTTIDYFERWANAPRVRATYRADLAQIAAFLDAQKPTGTVLLSARFPADLDQEALALLQARKQRYLWFNGRRVLVLPDDRSGQGVSYVIPATNESQGDGAALLRTLEAQSGPPDEAGKPSFVLYYLPPEELRRLREPMPAYPLSARVGTEVEVAGVDGRVNGRALHLLMTWRVLHRLPGDFDRTFFTHLVDGQGRRYAQEDRSGYPTSSWREGDLIWQWSDLTLPADAAAGEYFVELGVYDANAPGQLRLPVFDAGGTRTGDSVRAGPFALR